MRILNLSLNGINNNFSAKHNGSLRVCPLKNNDSFEFSESKIKKYRSGYPNEGINFDRYQNKKTYVMHQNQSFSILRESDINSSLIELEAQSKDKKIITVFYMSNKHRDMSYCEYTVQNKDNIKKLKLQWDKKENYRFFGDRNDIKTMINALDNLRTVMNSTNYERDFGRSRNTNIQIKKTIDYLSDLVKESEFKD